MKNQSGEAEVIPLRLRKAQATRLEQIFEEVRPLLLKFVSHRLGAVVDSQDVVQSVFVKLWERRSELDQESLRPLIFVAARNMATDILRSSRRGRLELLNSARPSDATIGDDHPSPEREVIGRSELDFVRSIIAELPAKCRHAFIQHKLEGRDYAEIAAEMTLSQSMVRKYIKRSVLYCSMRFAQREGWE